jgi:hypothetical protein
VENYKPLANELIGKMKIDRNAIRALQIRRTYEIIEGLMEELRESRRIGGKGNGEDGGGGIKDRALLYNQIYKFSSHLALITGLNIETQVQIDPQKLVIIRSKKDKNTVDTQSESTKVLLNSGATDESQMLDTVTNVVELA